jgi:predicted  nucleic acid-binding Zn-ribbon protein
VLPAVRDMQLPAPLQLARVEGQKASLESELRAANEDLELLPARLEEAMAAADATRAEARASADKVIHPHPLIAHWMSSPLLLSSQPNGLCMEPQDELVSGPLVKMALRLLNDLSHGVQAATLERHVSELEDEVGQLAAAAQAAEEQAVQLMQQVQAANAAEAGVQPKHHLHASGRRHQEY